MRISYCRLCAVAIVALAFATGAGCGGDSGLVVHSVTGAVTQDGAPVADAVVGFSPATPVDGFAGAQATTDAQGRFDVIIPAVAGKQQLHGLPPGQYHVTVVKMQSGPGAASLSNPPKNVLPAKYATPESSPLSATVNADGENVVDLKL